MYTHEIQAVGKSKITDEWCGPIYVLGNGVTHWNSYSWDYRHVYSRMTRLSDCNIHRRVCSELFRPTHQDQFVQLMTQSVQILVQPHQRELPSYQPHMSALHPYLDLCLYSMYTPQ